MGMHKILRRRQWARVAAALQRRRTIWEEAQRRREGGGKADAELMIHQFAAARPALNALADALETSKPRHSGLFLGGAHGVADRMAAAVKVYAQEVDKQGINQYGLGGPHIHVFMLEGSEAASVPPKR